MRATRDPGGTPEMTGVPNRTGPVMRITDQTLQELAAQVGAGDHAAFRHLYTACAPAALLAVRGHLPDPAQSMHVVRATFCEVWWMCAFDVRCGAETPDIPTWITAIAYRRGAERHQALQLIGEANPRGRAAFWSGLLDIHDRSTQFELAAMLGGQDHIKVSGVG